MKKTCRIVAVLLIIAMLSTCVYATETSEESVEPEQNTQMEELPESDDSEAFVTEEAQEIPEYIKELRFAGGQAASDGSVTLNFEWSLADGERKPDGYKVYINETEKELPDLETPEYLEADRTSVSFEGLKKGKTYYIAVQPYVSEDGAEKDGAVCFNSGLYIDDPEITKLTPTDKTVTVTFKQVEGASYYILRNETLKTDTEISFGKTTAVVKGLTNNKSYSFSMIAVYEKDGQSQSTESAVKSTTTKITVPGKPTLKLDAYNKGAILSWTKVSGATSYQVYRWYNNKWTRIKTLKTTTYKNTGLKLNKKYKYKVRAVRTVGNKSAYGAYSAVKSITAKSYLTGSIKIGYSSGVLIRPAKKYKEGSSTKVVSESMIAAGTRITIIKTKKIGEYKMANIKLSNGTKYWIRRGNISFYAPYTTKDYTKKTKENFVNKKKYSSKTKYLLFICNYTQKTYVFKGKKGAWKLYKTFKCVTGKASTRTPLGVFKIYNKHRYGWSYQYVSYFKSRNAFHSKPYGTSVMGQPASNGCIRLYDNDAKFVYQCVPKGTTVVSY